MNKLLFVVTAACLAGFVETPDRCAAADSQSLEDWLRCQRFAEIMACESLEPSASIEPPIPTIQRAADAGSRLWSYEELQCQRFTEVMPCESVEPLMSGLAHAADAVSGAAR